jgi:hypothetical protein
MLQHFCQSYVTINVAKKKSSWKFDVYIDYLIKFLLVANFFQFKGATTSTKIFLEGNKTKFHQT